MLPVSNKCHSSHHITLRAVSLIDGGLGFFRVRYWVTGKSKKCVVRD